MPREAILTDAEGNTTVLVIEETPEGTILVEEEVTTGAGDALYVTIDAEDLAGQILNRAATYRDYIDQPVTISEIPSELLR